MVLPPAARYDSEVAGPDEARARSALANMQDRLARGPVAALGIAATATAEDARAAFLQLTKQFHPVRFGRMAGDVQKLANEVFLALRAAHDQVIKSQRRPAAAAGSQPLAAGASKTQPVPLRPLRPATGESGERAPVAAGSTVGRPAPPRPGARMSSPSPPRPIAAAPAAPAAASEAAVIDLLQRQQWDQARSALHQLSAREPNSKRLRALVCYARGREAQLDRRVDDARVELQDALDLDPNLQLAKTALTELFTRRK